MVGEGGGLFLVIPFALAAQFIIERDGRQFAYPDFRLAFLRRVGRVNGIVREKGVANVEENLQ